MSLLAKVLSLSYDSAVASKTSALKTYYRSVRLIKDDASIVPTADSKYTNILLCGNCIDPEKRNLYVFYIDTFYGSAWIIEINIDTRVQTVVLFDKYNAIGFSPLNKFYNARVVHGRLVWTDNRNPIYQMDIERAKKSYLYKIGYGQYPNTESWNEITDYDKDQIVSNGNHFYQSLIFGNIAHEPRSDNGTRWSRLCLIEDAYYSIKPENFYFEPMPPKHPPVVIYKSDDTRKINNLRQTLFQVAYRYVYMDWRKSTYSPASVVPVPQAEEETATGLANEQISLNNQLEITVNTGGEEVRAIEVIGRSSQDPSKWFLIDTINKFEEQERGGEISKTSESNYGILTISIPAPTVISLSMGVPDGQVDLGISILDPVVSAEQDIVLSNSSMTFGNSDQGLASYQSTIVTLGELIPFWTIVSHPAWMVHAVYRGGSPITGVNPYFSGDELRLYPQSINTGTNRSGTVVLSPVASIDVFQNGHNPTINNWDVSNYPGLAITDNTYSALTPGMTDIQIQFRPNLTGTVYIQLWSDVKGYIGTQEATQVINGSIKTFHITAGLVDTDINYGENYTVYITNGA